MCGDRHKSFFHIWYLVFLNFLLIFLLHIFHIFFLWKNHFFLFYYSIPYYLLLLRTWIFADFTVSSFWFKYDFPKSREASVSTEDNLKAGPYIDVVNNTDFPIPTNPSWVAIILWGNSNELNSTKSVLNCFFVCSYHYISF